MGNKPSSFHYVMGCTRAGKAVFHVGKGGYHTSLCGRAISGGGTFWSKSQASNWLTLPGMLQRGCKQCVTVLEGRPW